MMAAGYVGFRSCAMARADFEQAWNTGCEQG
jgi:hypothetical protein